MTAISAASRNVIAEAGQDIINSNAIDKNFFKSRLLYNVGLGQLYFLRLNGDRF